MSFSVETRELGSRIVRLAVFGRLDAATDHLLQEAIRDVLATKTAKGIVIDLGGAAVIDVAGIRAIENSHRIADQANLPIVVVNATSSTVRSTLDGFGILTATSGT